MELDATQALDTDYGDEEIKETEDRKIQVAELRVQKTKGFAPNSFIIYEGQNIVGRHEKADVYIPLKPLSKKHACIEVISGQHFIYDFGSKNKTRRGKMILRPNVRYELTDGSQLLFADVKCEYKFIEVPQENDDTDSMSEVDSESMLLIEDGMVGNEHEKSMASERGNILQQEQPMQPVGDSNPTMKEGGTEKQKLNMTDEDVYAAETDSDTDNEIDRPCRATPARSSQLTSIVKQTPGTLLHRMQRGSLNETTDSTNLINDSMQSLEASNLSLKLDITQGSETALSPQANRSKNNQSHSNETATLVLQEELRPITDQSSARIKDNQSPAEEIPTLVLHESSDEADDAETARTGLLDFSDLSLSGARNGRLKETVESKEPAGLSEEPSARPKETAFLSTELSAVPKEMGGLLIQESDEESTDMSDNEAMKSDIAGSGFFSPDVLLQKYGMKKFDGASETDRSDVEIPFSPGVVRNSCDVSRNKQVRKDDNEGGGGNEENCKEKDGALQEYILMPTQAYGVVDSDSESTDVEDNGITDRNLTDNKNDKFSASTENRQIKENRCQNSCSKIDGSSLTAQMQHTVPSEGSLSGAGSALLPGLRTLHKEQAAVTVPIEPTMPLEATIPLDSTVGNETVLSDKLSPSRDFPPAKHRIAPINKFSQTAETVPQHDSGTTEVSMNDSLTASALYDSMQEADTISMQDSEAYDKIMDKNASQSYSEPKMMSSGEQEAATVVVTNNDQEAGTVLQDADEHATTDPVRGIEQDAATVSLQDSVQEATTTPVNGGDQQASTVSLQKSSQEAATVTGHDRNQEATIAPVNGTDQEASTVSLQKSSQEAATVTGHDRNQEATIAPVNGTDQEASTVSLQKSSQEAATVTGHDRNQEATIAPVNGTDQEASTVSLQKSSQEAATVTGHDRNQEATIAPVNGTDQEASTVSLQKSSQEAATVTGHDRNQEATIAPVNGTDQEASTVSLQKSSQEAATVTGHDRNQEATIAPVNGTDQEASTVSLQKSSQEAATVTGHDRNQEATIAPVNGTDQEASTVSLQKSSQEAATVTGHDRNQEATIAPVNGTDQEASTVSLQKSSQEAATVTGHDRNQEATIAPVNGTDQEASTVSLQKSSQEAATVTGHDRNQEATIAPVNGTDQEASTVSLQKSSQEAATVTGHDRNQEATIAPVNGTDQEASTVSLQKSSQEAATVTGHDRNQEATIAPVNGTDQEASTVSLQKSSQEAATVPRHDSDQEAMSVQFQGASSLEETVPLAETRNFTDDAALVQTSDMAPNQEDQHGEVSDPSYNEEATQGYDILPPKKPVEKRRDKPPSEPVSTFTLPGGSTLKHVTWGAGTAKLGVDSNERGRSNTESSDIEETQAYVEDDDCATQAYGVESATVPNDGGEHEVVAETQQDDESNIATQSYGYLDQPTLFHESPIASPSESKTGKGPETDIDECATQAYGLLDQPTVPYDYKDGGSNENNSNDVDKTDDDECATQAYGLLDQPTVPYDNEDGGSNERNPENTNESVADDDCATQAYGLVDQATVTYDLQGEDQNDDSAMDECATQAYGLQDQPTQSYNLSPVAPAKDEEAEKKRETAIDECETQAYGMEDDAVRHSDDEDCPTQAYGIMDLPTFPYEEATDSLTGNSNRRTDGGSHKESQDKTEDQTSESLFVKPTVPQRSQDGGSHEKSQDEMEDQLSGSMFVTPAVPRRSRGKTKMAASGGKNLNKETERKRSFNRNQPSGRRNLESHDTNNKQRELDGKGDGPSSESQQTGKQNSNNRVRNKEKSEPDITEDKRLGNSVLVAAEEHANEGKGRSKRSVRSKVSFKDDDRDIGDKETSEFEVTNESLQVATGAIADGRKKTASARRRKTASGTKDTDAKQSQDALEKQHDIIDKERSCTEAEQEDAGNMTGSAAVKAGRSTAPGGRASTLKNLNKTIKTVEERVGVNGKDDIAEITEVGKDSTEKEAASKTHGGKTVRRGRPLKKNRSGKLSMDEERTAAPNEIKTSSVQPPEEQVSKKDRGRSAQRETAAAKRDRAPAERTVVQVSVDEAKDVDSEQGSAKLKETEASKTTKRETVAKRGRASAKRTVDGDPVGRKENNESEEARGVTRGTAAKRVSSSGDKIGGDVSVNQEEDLKDADSERNNSKLKEEEDSEIKNLKRNKATRGGSAKKGRSCAKRTKEETETDNENNTNKTENEAIIETDSETEASMRSTKSKTTQRSLASNIDKDMTKTTVSQNEQQSPTASFANCSADEFSAKSSGGRGRKRGKQSVVMNQAKLSDTENSPTGPSKKNAKEDFGGESRSAKGRNSKGKGTASKLAEDSPTMKSPSIRPTLRALDEVPKIMFTGLTDKSVEKSVTQLGAELANSVYDATHLVTDKVRRTVKFLCCLARGIDIVEPSWLEHCRNSKEFTNTEKYVIKDKNTEKQYNFDLKRSIAKAKEKELLDGYSLYVTKNVKPDQKQMKDIIQCSGGKALLKLPKNLDEKTLIISCEEDKTEIKNLTQSGIPVHTAELLLTGILRQELDFDQFRLEVGCESTKKVGKRTQSASELDKSVSSAKRRKR